MTNLVLAVRSPLPLREGEVGEAVIDLQQRLDGLGYPVTDQPGHFGPSTTGAVRSFQASRKLKDDGLCDEVTWSVLVEAGYRPGDRLLFVTAPMLRGDDVAELQRRLSALGFDTGRIDGIFGEQTRRAVFEFQRNVALPADGICGHATISELMRLELREGGADLVTPLRERLQVAGGGSRNLAGRRIGVGERGGFAAGVASSIRALRQAGAQAIAIEHPDASHQASEANARDVACFVSLVLTSERTTCTTAYYSGFRYESLASRRLAELVQASLPGALDLGDGGIVGLALPILRETRMPAIEVELGLPAQTVQHTSDLARSLVEALSSWIDDSFDESS